MNPTALESDLLDLIEGRLPPERMAGVRAALTSDPALLRRVERMVADRKGVAELSRATEQAARTDRARAAELVHGAIGLAEREALMGEYARVRKTRSALAAGVAVVLFVGLVAAGTVVFIARGGGSADSGRFRSLRFEASPDIKIEKARPAPLEANLGTEAGSAAPDGAAAQPKGAGLAWWVKPVQDEGAAAMLEDWTKEVKGHLAHESLGAGSIDPDAVAAGAAVRADGGGARELSLEEAAAVALTRRLRLVVPAGDVILASERLSAVHGLRAQEAVSGAGTFEARVSAALDPQLAALGDELERLRRRLTGSFGSAPRFEIDDAQEGPAVLPASSVEDVLWWADGPKAWHRGVSVLVRVVVVPARAPGTK